MMIISPPRIIIFAGFTPKAPPMDQKYFISALIGIYIYTLLMMISGRTFQMDWQTNLPSPVKEPKLLIRMIRMSMS